MARALVALGLEATDRVRRRIARHGIACNLRDGHFHAACKPAHLDHMRREIDLLGRLVDYQAARIVERKDVPAIVATEAYHGGIRSEEHTSELQSLMRISYAVFCLKKKKHNTDSSLLY